MFMDASYGWNCVPAEFMTAFSMTISSGTTFHIMFSTEKHTV
jgi:hypothetical protein